MHTVEPCNSNLIHCILCSLSAPIHDTTAAADASWLNKYTGVADLMTMVDWMMSQSWGHSPSDLGMLKELKHAFKTTTVGQASSLFAFVSIPFPS